MSARRAALRPTLLSCCLAWSALLPAQSPDGQELFRRHCGICHLQGGGGTWMLERRLGTERSLLESRQDLQPAYVKFVARRGLAAMPRFTRVDVTDGELEAIAGYLARNPKP